MPTNLHIDDKLLEQVLKASGKRTKREAVNEALTEYVQRRDQLKILEFFGTMEIEDWDDKSVKVKP
jgi:Arc/MetJ family transcription regulator